MTKESFISLLLSGRDCIQRLNTRTINANRRRARPLPTSLLCSQSVLKPDVRFLFTLGVKGNFRLVLLAALAPRLESPITFAEGLEDLGGEFLHVGEGMTELRVGVDDVLLQQAGDMLGGKP